MTHPEDLLSQFRLDCEETGSELGRGSYATVIELQYKGLRCAGKKVYRALYRQNLEHYVHKFTKECRLISELRHPNIVQFLGVYFEPEDHTPVLVLEYIPMTLAESIEKYPNMPSEITYSILTDVALGLRYLHEQDTPIIHRDLSANNVLLTENFTAKISDLGVAKIVDIPLASLATMTRVPGTPCYMPPEALVPNPKYNISIDVFSYGILILHIFSQKWPLPTEANIVDPHQQNRLIPVSESDRRLPYLEAMGLSHPLAGLACSCLSNDSGARPRAAEIWREVDGAYAQQQQQSSERNRLELLLKLTENDKSPQRLGKPSTKHPTPSSRPSSREDLVESRTRTPRAYPSSRDGLVESYTRTPRPHPSSRDSLVESQNRSPKSSQLPTRDGPSPVDSRKTTPLQTAEKPTQGGGLVKRLGQNLEKPPPEKQEKPKQQDRFKAWAKPPQAEREEFTKATRQGQIETRREGEKAQPPAAPPQQEDRPPQRNFSDNWLSQATQKQQQQQPKDERRPLPDIPRQTKPKQDNKPKQQFEGTGGNRPVEKQGDGLVEKMRQLLNNAEKAGASAPGGEELRNNEIPPAKLKKNIANEWLANANKTPAESKKEIVATGANLQAAGANLGTGGFRGTGNTGGPAAALGEGEGTGTWVAEVLFDFDARDDDELTVRAGQFVEILNYESCEEDDQWWLAKRDDLIGTIPRTYARPPVKKAQEATPLKAAPKEVLKKLTPTKAAMDKSMNFDQEGQSRGYCNWEVKAEKKEEKGAMKKSEFSKRKQMMENLFGGGPTAGQPPPAQDFTPPTIDHAPQIRPPAEIVPTPPQRIHMATPTGPVYVALFAYSAGDEEEVSFSKGDEAIEVSPIDDGWMEGRIRRTGECGMMPRNYFQRK